MTIVPSPTMGVFVFIKSNVESAPHFGNYNGDVQFPHAYLLVSNVITLFSPLLVNFRSLLPQSH